jgi:hypothetical protein
MVMLGLSAYTYRVHFSVVAVRIKDEGIKKIGKIDLRKLWNMNSQIIRLKALKSGDI